MFKVLKTLDKGVRKGIIYSFIYIACIAGAIGLSVGLMFHPNRQVYLKCVLETNRIKSEAIDKGYAMYLGKVGDTSNWVWKDDPLLRRSANNYSTLHVKSVKSK
jgi:hypothetical protein